MTAPAAATPLPPAFAALLPRPAPPPQTVEGLPPEFAALLPPAHATPQPRVSVPAFHAVSRPRLAAPARGATQQQTLPPEFAALLPTQTAPTPGQQARALWAKTPAWQKPLMFVEQGFNDVGTGIAHLLGADTSGPIPQANFGRYAAPQPQQPAPGVNSALDAQHPWLNALVKWPTELLASTPLGEGVGAAVGAGMDALGLAAPEGANLLTRAAYALPRSMATGAAYGVQQPRGNPGVNAAIGAVTGPLLEGALHGVGAVGGKAADAMGGLWRGITRSVPDQDELDARVADYLRKQGAPLAVATRPTPEGVQLTTAVHANDPTLLDLQGKERAGTRAVPFHELATQNNGAILRGMRDNLAPNADQATVATAAHDILQSAQARGKAAVRAAYAPFDALKGGVYLQREPIQNALREAYEGLLPAHREVLPAKFREVMEATGPLHLSNDVEDLQARLSDLIADAAPYSPKARALLIARDALTKGTEAAPLAGELERPPLVYDPAKAPLPKRNMVEPDPREDSILQWLAKHPKGLSSEEAVAQGLDPADMRSSVARVGLKRAFRQGGMSFDQAAEALHQAGYPVADAAGHYDPNALLDAVDGELRGKPTYSVANTRRFAEVAQEAPRTAEPVDITDLASRAMQANPERAQAILDGWTDDNPETLARVQSQLRDAIAPKGVPDATQAWNSAKLANRAFRDRFPQGTARDTEARRWLSDWLTGQKDPTKFLREAFALPSRARAVLDALQDDPAEREQVRQLMRNHYVNDLMSRTRAAIPGQQVLNADALTKARGTSAALERTILTPAERAMLDTYGEAAANNAKILQRTVGGSSETASLLRHQAGKVDELLGSGVAHAASKVHPVAGALVHLMLPRGSSDAAAEALQRTLTNALLDPETYNRVMGSEMPESGWLKLLRAAGKGVSTAVPRVGAFTLPRGLGPVMAR